MFEETSIEETRKRLGAGERGGLSEREARERLSACGPNALEQRKKRSLWRRFLAQLLDPLIGILLAAGILSLLLGEAADACIVAAVVLLNAAVGLVQEGKAQKALDALKEMTQLRALVRRDGNVREIDARELVPGDLVLLAAGRQVPADLRLVASENLRIEESALTGESVPAGKDAGFLAGTPLPAGDCKNLAFMSTNVTAGRGEGLVTATGMETEIGKIAKLIHEAPEEATPLQKRLGDLGAVLSALAVGLCAALFGAAVLQGRDAAEMFLTAISLAVAAVPEGLPAVVTIVLALSVSRLVKVHTIVRRLPSVETLGAVNVVCTDKTGTLTKNQMTVVEAADAAELLGEGQSRQQAGQQNGRLNGRQNEQQNGEQGGQAQLRLAFALCNDAGPAGEGGFGDPTELALLEYAERGNGETAPGRTGTAASGKSGECREHAWVSEMAARYPRIAERPFDSERKRMTTVHRMPGGGTVSFGKGAPDVILGRCSRYLSGDGSARPLTPRARGRIEAKIREWSGQGLRVLGAAKRDGDGRDETELTFLGLAGMTDPPRPEVPHALRLFKRARVRTVMITGDHRDTAFAVAKRLGIADRPGQCMSGEEIEGMDDVTLRNRVFGANVFARVSSDHKVRIVRALKENGNIVAMTGDGVNDAPSLKAADVGIAMGKSGTDVAKQAADIVLTDDNFATIEKAIEEGRGVYENIRKSVIFLLSSNFGEVMTMFFAILLALPSPLKASHILWINLITDSLPALALGVDRNDGEALMDEKPRRADESLFARGGLACTAFYGVLITVISLTAYLCVPVRLLSAAGLPITPAHVALVLQDGRILAHCQTYAFTVLGLSQLFHAVGMRNVQKSVFCMNHLENKLMLLALAVGFLLQLSVTEIPALVGLFQTVRLEAAEWRGLLFLAAMPMAAHELLVLLGHGDTA